MSATEAPTGKDECSNTEMMPCTCRQTPLTVTLDDFNREKPMLIHNLRMFGWSPLRIRSPNDSAPPTQSQILNVFRQYHERKKSETLSSKDDSDLIYIAAESGSSQGTVEPKESIEVAMSRCNISSTSCDRNDKVSVHSIPPHIVQVKKWCQSLSWIAHQVCEEVLEIPSDTFLSSSTRSKDDSSLDLLRVFHYYALDDACSQKADSAIDNHVLGSSPHTDWGSLTVVWQDHVGGLQTYCRKCEKWIEVPPPADDDQEPTSHWQVIVHVGDMASIVLNALSLGSDDSPQRQEHSSALWPSPKHRVVSSQMQERFSLVYFAYPPGQTSLNGIQDALQARWPLLLKEQHHHHRLPLKEYYLLHDQSIGSDSTKTPEEMHREIWTLPIQDIVQLKWRQVHRGSGNDTG